MDEIKDVAADDFAPGVAQIVEGRRFRIVEDGSVGADEGNAVRAFLDQRTEAAFAGFEDPFRLLAAGDVLDDTQRVERFVVRTADQRGGEIYPDDALGFGDVALFQL